MSPIPKKPKSQAPQGSPTEDETIHIKKYGNRRLYSSAEKRFVTIEELADSVRKGDRVRVTDADTDADITSEVLTQILLGVGRAQHFPVEMLEQMIRMNEVALKTFWSSYIDQSIKVVESFQENWQALRKANLFFQWMEKPSKYQSETAGKSPKNKDSSKKDEK